MQGEVIKSSPCDYTILSLGCFNNFKLEDRKEHLSNEISQTLIVL